MILKGFKFLTFSPTSNSLAVFKVIFNISLFVDILLMDKLNLLLSFVHFNFEFFKYKVTR